MKNAELKEEVEAYKEATQAALEVITTKFTEIIGAMDGKINGIAFYLTEALQEITTEEQRISIEKRLVEKEAEIKKEVAENENKD